jgi:hypothetical protein
MPATGQSELTIRRLSVNYHVARNHPRPERARWQLDEIANGLLGEALGRALAPLGSRSDGEIILIQRLEVDVDLDTSRDASSLAARWAARLAAGLAAALGPGAAGVVRFPDVRSYLARFLVDVAGGRAWGKWYYQRFAGLSPLPAPAVIRTAVLDDIEVGLGALRALSPAELRLVLRVAGEQEARRVVETVGEGGGEGGGDGLVDALIAAIGEWRVVAPPAASPWITALGRLIHAAGKVEAASWPAAARLAAAISSWSGDRTDAGGLEPSEDPVHGRRASPLPGALQGGGRARLLAALSPLSAAQRARLAEALTERPPAARRSGAAARSQTPFGGLLLLIPHVGALPLAEEWPLESDAAMARLLILAKCAGTDRAPRVLADPVLGALVGVEGGATPHHAAQWLEANQSRLTDGFAWGLAERAASRRPGLTVTVGRVGGRGALVGATQPEGLWRFALPFSNEIRRALRNGRDHASGMGDVRLDAGLPAARAVTGALRYLRLHGPPGAPFEADLALTVAAQQVLRGFARRLPGFAESSPGHVYACFLDFEATIEASEARLACHLGRPPLATLLDITGIRRGRIPIPWREGPPLELLTRG